MSIPKEPDPAKLVISLFMNNKDIFESVLPELEKLFGTVDMISNWFNFDFTDYYYSEMGSPLFRKVVVFKELIHQSLLAEIKEKTNLLEKKWASNYRINDEIKKNEIKKNHKIEENIKNSDELKSDEIKSGEIKEDRFALKRSLNIDPGYLLLSRFILATGKDYSHRIYVGRGIYADLTLIYKKGGFKSLEWTYPDYASEEMCSFLEQVRAKYSNDLKQVRLTKL